MSELAKSILLQITPSGTKLLINGTEFQYHVAAEDLVVHGQRDGFAFARVSILAEQVTVSADLSNPVEVTETEQTHPAPAPWTKGWRFVMEATEKPPGSVRILRCVGDSSHYPLLVRVKKDLWAWGNERNELIDSGEGESWSVWSDPEGVWASAEFVVEEVSWDPFQ